MKRKKPIPRKMYAKKDTLSTEKQGSFTILMTEGDHAYDDIKVSKFTENARDIMLRRGCEMGAIIPGYHKLFEILK